MNILMDMTCKEMEACFKAKGIPAFRARQVFGWLQKGAGFDEMTNLPAALREQLAREFELGGCRIEHKAVSALDGTTKYLFVFSDLNMVEGVLMRHHYGNTLCISTQVGCRMGCAFCASTLEGRVRNLSAGEMLGQVIAANRDAGGGGQRAITNIVLMGSGEPLDYYDAVVTFLRRVNDPEEMGISVRNISLSTCGLVPQMRALADEEMGVTLSISLHAPTDALRRSIMPIANTYSVEEVMDAARYYVHKTGRRVIFEYALVQELNDAPEHARQLAVLLKGLQCHVNVIALNPVAETGLVGSQPQRVNAFMAALSQQNVSASRRATMGADLDGACGQLRRRVMKETENGKGEVEKDAN